MQTTEIKWKHWNTAPLRLWQTQLNIVVFCTSSVCGVNSEHLNYEKHSKVRVLHPFHVYYHIRGVLKKLQVLLPVLSLLIILTAVKKFFKLCEDCNIPHDPMRYQDEKFYWTYQ